MQTLCFVLSIYKNRNMRLWSLSKYIKYTLQFSKYTLAFVTSLSLPYLYLLVKFSLQLAPTYRGIYIAHRVYHGLCGWEGSGEGAE